MRDSSTFRTAPWDADAALEFCRPGLWRRLWSGAKRRLAAPAPNLAIAVARAVGWLRDSSRPIGLATYLGPGSGDPVVCPAATAQGIIALAPLGMLELTDPWLAALRHRQLPDGALGDATGAAPSVFNTGLFLAACLAQGETVRQTSALWRAAEYLTRHIDARGELVRHARAAGSLDHRHPSIHLAWAPALLAAAHALRHDGWREAAERLIDRLSRGHWPRGIDEPAHTTLRGLVGLAQLRLPRPVGGSEEENPPVATRRGDAQVEQRETRSTSAAGLALTAHLAALRGDPGTADRALITLARTQRADGGFPSRWRPGAVYAARRISTWAALEFLLAVQARVATAFAGAADDVPARIDPRDGRAQAVVRWAQTLPPTAVVADVGCGRGRYLRLLAEVRPRARWIAIDPSPNLLASITSRATRRVGSLLRLPAADAEFDAALAIESLEHCLLPERAAAELARAVRPGGSILVIDKDRARQGRSRHAPWERWFAPTELNGWLAAACDKITTEPVAHGPHRQADGLYWLWHARRRGVSAQESTSEWASRTSGDPTATTLRRAA